MTELTILTLVTLTVAVASLSLDALRMIVVMELLLLQRVVMMGTLGTEMVVIHHVLVKVHVALWIHLVPHIVLIVVIVNGNLD